MKRMLSGAIFALGILVAGLAPAQGGEAGRRESGIADGSFPQFP